MQRYLSDLATIGLQQAHVDQGRQLAQKLEALSAEREALKALAEAKTAELYQVRAEAFRWYRFVWKRVKAALMDQPEIWGAFGLTAKQ